MILTPLILKYYYKNETNLLRNRKKEVLLQSEF
jgi:hypothetical protein